MPSADVPFTAFRFEVILDLDTPSPGLSSPLCNAAFAECDGLEMTMEPKAIPAGGVNNRQIHRIGPVKYAQLSLKRGMTSNLQLWTWFTLASQTGRISTANGKITMWDSDGTPAVEFTLTRCLPVKIRAPSLNAKDGLVAVEELGLVYEQLTVALPGAAAGLGVSAGISAGVSFGASIGASASIGVSGGVDLNASAGASVDVSATAGLSL